MERSSAASAGTLDTPSSTVDQPEDPAQQPPLLARPAPAAVVAIALAGLAFASYPAGGRAALAAFLAAVLVVLAAVDLERRIIPNRIVLPATLVVLAAHIAIEPGRTVELIAAPLVAGLFLLIPNLINPAAMGIGDVKMALLLGVGLGWGVIGALLVGFFATVPFSVAIIVRGGRAALKTESLPLGPFLAFGGLVLLIVPRLT